MRSTKERAAAVSRRVKEIRRQKQLRRERIIGVSAVAAGFSIVLGFSFAFPSLMARLPCGDYSYFGAAGSILDGGSGFGFVIVGLVSFLLGVCVTILCNRIHLKSEKNNMEDKNG